MLGVLKSSSSPGSPESGRFIPAARHPLEPGGLLPPVCCLNEVGSCPFPCLSDPNSCHSLSPRTCWSPPPWGLCGLSLTWKLPAGFCRAHALPSCLCLDATFSLRPPRPPCSKPPPHSLSPSPALFSSILFTSINIS